MAAMSLDLNRLKSIKLTKEQQQFLVGGILGTAAAVYGYWAFLLTPLNKDITDLTAKVKEKQDSLDKAKKLKAGWEEYTQRLARVQTGTQFAARRLPAEADFTLQIEHMATMSMEGGVALTTFTSDSAQAGLTNKSEFPGYKKNVMGLTLTSDFHRIGMFLSRLSGEDIVFYIEDLGFTSLPDNSVHYTVAATMKLITYTDMAAGPKP